MSVIMRIMTNYLQIIASAFAFNLNFPNYLFDFQSSSKQAGYSSSAFLSFDCFLTNANVATAFNNVSYLKALLICLFPFIYLILCTIVIKFIFYKNKEEFKRWTCVTIITVLFVFHPTLTQYCLKIFKCVNIENGVSKVEMDIQTDCWSPIHLKWIFALSVPMLVVYVIGAPLLAFVILFKNRNSLGKSKTINYIILLYQGLRHKRYYWEFVNTIRKLTLLSLQVFIPESYRIIKILIGVLILFLCALMQARLSPFKIRLISELEHREMYASLLTLYGGLLFIQQESQLQVLNIFIFIIIFIVNLRFIILWIFCMLSVFKHRKYPGMAAIYIKKMFCMVINNDDEDKLCHKTNEDTEQFQKLDSSETSKIEIPFKDNQIALKDRKKYKFDSDLVKNNKSKKYESECANRTLLSHKKSLMPKEESKYIDSSDLRDSQDKMELAFSRMSKRCNKNKFEKDNSNSADPGNSIDYSEFKRDFLKDRSIEENDTLQCNSILNNSASILACRCSKSKDKLFEFEYFIN